MIDTNRITIVELADTTVWDKLCISEVNKNIIKETLQKVDLTFVKMPSFSVGRYVWGIERSGFFNGREKWAKGFENQRV